MKLKPITFTVENVEQVKERVRKIQDLTNELEHELDLLSNIKIKFSPE